MGIVFADDVSIISSFRQQLERALESVGAHLEELGFALNCAKRPGSVTSLPF